MTGLTACRTNVGTAASVGSYRIGESAVARYVTPTGAATSAAAGAQAPAQTASPRSQVVQALVQEQLFRRTLAAHGGVPDAGTLTSYHDPAAQVLLQTSLLGSALDKALARTLPKSGLRSSFTPTVISVLELEYALIKRHKLANITQLAALVGRSAPKVSVNPRYGTWKPSTLSLDTAGGVPGFLTLQPTAGAGAAAQ